MHDAILVGIGTALNDDPQLNGALNLLSMVSTLQLTILLVRHLPQPISTPYNLPRPVIIDTYLRLPTSCKLLRIFQNGIGRRPWIICVKQAGTTDHSEGKTTMAERKKALEDAGARIIEIPPSSVQDDLFPNAHLSLPVILKSLNDLGIRSLMVEGGAGIIGSFFAAPEKIVDSLIITVAPVLVGSEGVGYQCKYPVFDLSDSKKQASFREVHTELIGRDTVVSLQCTMKDS
jgi:2,5-diamino-6-(ribosylamino)-4(3H)-pyrimidinone 5'-phosphate reductase